MTVVAGEGPPDRVVVTDGGDGQGRSALAAVRVLARAGLDVGVTTRPGARHHLAATSRHRRWVRPLPAGEDPRYPAALAALRADVGWVVPASDAAVLALRPELAELVDKRRWARHARAAGLPPPPTVEAADAEALDGLDDLPLPAVIKPAVGRSPAVLVERREDLARLPAGEPVLAQPLLAGPMRAVAVAVAGGDLLASVHQRYLRTWPWPLGTACAAVTTPPDLDLEARLLALIAASTAAADGPALTGVVQAQLVGGHLIDVNARVYGSLPLGVRAGADLLGQALAAAGAPLHAEPPVRRAAAGVPYRWIEGDLRHLARRRTALGPLGVARALLPLPGAAHSVWAADDPAPALARLRHAGGRR